jgi:hypothetical protein
LGPLDEKTIWEQYQPAISIAGKCKFENFTEQNVQAFYRLKLQSIEHKIGTPIIDDGKSNQEMKLVVVSEADMPAVE